MGTSKRLAKREKNRGKKGEYVSRKFKNPKLTWKDYAIYLAATVLALSGSVFYAFTDLIFEAGVFRDTEVFAYSFRFRLLGLPFVFCCMIIVFVSVCGCFLDIPLFPSKNNPSENWILKPEQRKKWGLIGLGILICCILLAAFSYAGRWEYRTDGIVKYNLFGAESEWHRWSEISDYSLRVDTSKSRKGVDRSNIVFRLRGEGKRWRIKDIWFRDLNALVQFDRMLDNLEIRRSNEISSDDWMELVVYGDYSEEKMKELAQLLGEATDQ